MTEALVFRHVRAIDPAGALDAEVDVVVERGVVTRVGRDAGGRPAVERARPGRRAAGRLAAARASSTCTPTCASPGPRARRTWRAACAPPRRAGSSTSAACPTRAPSTTRASSPRCSSPRRARSGRVRLHPIGAITVGQQGEQLTEMADLKAAGAVAVSDDGRCVTSSQVMRRALEYAATFDLPVIQHAEDHALTEGAQMHEGAISTQARPARLAARRRGHHRRARRAPRRVRGRPLPRGARLDAGRRAHPARGQGARHAGHRRGDAAPPAPHRTRRSSATTRRAR